jgi:AcrR family transcriptional regulator
MPSADRGRITRERLLAAAAGLVGEVGWGGVTTRAVAERAEVNPALVHYHFASVTELLVAASTTVAKEMLDGALGALTAHDDVAEGLDWLLGELGQYTGTDPASLLLVEAFLAGTRIPDLRAELAALLAGFGEGVAGWLRAHDHPDPEGAATLFAASIDGLLLHRALDRSVDLRVAAGSLRRVLLPGRD